jgi:putative transposase
MGLARFELNRRVRLNGVEHVLTRMLNVGVWELENVRTGLRIVLETSVLHSKFVRGELAFVSTGVAPRSIAPDVSSPELELAKVRRLYVTAVFNVPNTRDRMAEAIKEVWERHRQPSTAPGVTSVFTWKKRYVASGNDLRALMDNTHRKGNRLSRYPGEVEAHCEAAIQEVYLRRERNGIKPTLENAEQRVRAENGLRPEWAQLSLPTSRFIRRLIGRLDAAEVYMARHGRDAARNKFRSVTRHRITEGPLERAEMDHTQLDVFVVDERTAMPLGRPYLTVCIDDYSRCVLGVYLGFEPPSYASVSKCLEDCFRPKVHLKEQYPEVQHEWPAHGVMRELVVDMGTEFHSNSLKLLCESVGIEIHYAARKEPWFKGKIERFLGTLNRAVAHTVPGKTFANIFERGDYDPSKHACLTLGTLRRIVMMWIADGYHHTIHRALGATPVSAWKAAIRPEDILLPDESVHIPAIIGTAHKRRLTHKGIEFEGLLYNSDEMTQLRRRNGDALDVEIRVDTQDIGHVYVLWPDSARPFKVPALMAEYAAGMSLWAHRKVREQQREASTSEADSIGLLETKRTIQELVERDLLQKKKRTRKRSGRFLEGAGRSPGAESPLPNRQPQSERGLENVLAEDTEPVPSASAIREGQYGDGELLDFTPRQRTY